jgi:hypothetical protein
MKRVVVGFLEVLIQVLHLLQQQGYEVIGLYEKLA